VGLTGSQHGQLKPLAGSGRSASDADTATCLENRNGNDLENSAGVVFRVLMECSGSADFFAAAVLEADG